MGSDAHVLVTGDHAEPHVEAAVQRIEQLEARWSRFLDDSEISQLNRLAGHPVVVSPDTYELVARSVDAWRATDGAFDPTVLEAMIEHGYDADLSEVRARGGAASAVGSRPRPAPGCGGIVCDPVVPSVTLPVGVGIDPGGIGKGLAADLVVRERIDAGADGVLVNLGGDVRVSGTPPDGGRWPIGVVDHLDPDAELTRVAIDEGAVATSSRMQRRWQHAGGEQHHLIDPLTGEPHRGDVVGVTVVAAEGWWAEAQTKAVFSAGADTGLARLQDASAVVTDEHGRHHATPDLEEALR